MLGKDYKESHYKIYEQDGLLYQAEILNDKNKIEFYTPYGMLWHVDHQQIKTDVSEKFNVKFIDRDEDIVCRCGQSKSFSAYYGVYELILICNKCDNEFTAYSG